MTEAEVRGLCIKSREIFLSQPILLELEAPLKICGRLDILLQSGKDLNRFNYIPSPQLPEMSRFWQMCVCVSRTSYKYKCNEDRFEVIFFLSVAHLRRLSTCVCVRVISLNCALCENSLVLLLFMLLLWFLMALMSFSRWHPWAIHRSVEVVWIWRFSSGSELSLPGWLCGPRETVSGDHLPPTGL